MILDSFKKFFQYYKEERTTFYIYACISLIAGFLELIGVALTYPFVLKIISNDSKIMGNFSALFIGVSIIVLFLLKNVFMIFYTYCQSLYVNKFEAKIKLDFMKFFLTAPYMESAKMPLSMKNKIFSLLIPNIMNNFIFRLLNLSVNIFIFAFIAFCLAVKFPLAALVSILGVLLLVMVQNVFYKPLLKSVSEKISKLVLNCHQSYNELLIGFKSIKVSNNEKYFYDKFQNATEQYYNLCSKKTFMNMVPPYITEPFIIIILFLFLSIISYQTYTSPDKLVASFAIIVSAIFRLAPTISRLQININGIHSSIPIVKEFLEICEKNQVYSQKSEFTSAFQKFEKTIELCNINFEYQEQKPVLKDINLEINKGEFIGIAGLSGAGKTTLIDIITGLYTPTSGNINIDGLPADSKLKIGYIPQEFILISGTIKDNVVFGSPNADDDKVIDALKKAQLYDFIKDNYNEGIYSSPFTDSIGFSQGQKQRLAIARALYSDPDILIMDEATSSLDLKTEDKICDILKELKGDKTIIVIAHRLSTIKSADRIIFLENGTITGNANFDELIKTNESFAELVKLANVKKNSI